MEAAREQSLISATYKRSLGSGTRKAMMVLMADKASDDGRGIYASKHMMDDELDLSKQKTVTYFYAWKGGPRLEGELLDLLMAESNIRFIALVRLNLMEIVIF